MTIPTAHFIVDGHCLSFSDSDKTIEFKWPIGEVIDFDDVIVVRLEPPPGTRFSQNVYGVDPARGEIAWRMEHRFHIPYTHISREGDTLNAFNWNGWDDTIDRKTGKVTSSRFLK